MPPGKVLDTQTYYIEPTDPKNTYKVSQIHLWHLFWIFLATQLLEAITRELLLWFSIITTFWKGNLLIYWLRFVLIAKILSFWTSFGHLMPFKIELEVFVPKTIPKLHNNFIDTYDMALKLCQLTNMAKMNIHL